MNTQLTKDTRDPPPTILVLDDDPVIRRVMDRILSGQGYEVLSAGRAHEARRVLDEHEGPIDLLLCDLVLPDLSGREAANLLMARRPELRVIFTSGYSSHGSFRGELAHADWAFLAKPFEPAQLLEVVAAALEGANGEAASAGGAP